MSAGFSSIDHSWDCTYLFFFSHFALSEERHSIFILNSPVTVEQTVWQGDVSQGQGWLLLRVVSPHYPPTHSSLRKSSFMVPELLSGWLNSPQLIFN